MSDATAIPPGGEPRRVRSQQSKGFAQSVAFSAARGALLIGVAVVIGIVLLQVVDNDTTGPVGDGGDASGAGVVTSTTTTVAGDASSTTTTTTAQGGGARQPSEISVQVLNASGVQNAAANLTQQIQAGGYQVLTPEDTDAATGTAVYCTGGLDREASALAATVGGDPPPNVEALPDPPPTNSDSDANCIVVLGG